jgi:hypothetical protein
MVQFNKFHIGDLVHNRVPMRTAKSLASSKSNPRVRSHCAYQSESSGVRVFFNALGRNGVEAFTFVLRNGPLASRN